MEVRIATPSFETTHFPCGWPGKTFQTHHDTKLTWKRIEEWYKGYPWNEPFLLGITFVTFHSKKLTVCSAMSSRFTLTTSDTADSYQINQEHYGAKPQWMWSHPLEYSMTTIFALVYRLEPLGYVQKQMMKFEDLRFTLTCVVIHVWR